MFLFAYYTSNDDSNFWKKCLFGSKKLVLLKNYQQPKMKVSKVKFWPKTNMQISAYTKSLNLELYLQIIGEMLSS